MKRILKIIDSILKREITYRNINKKYRKTPVEPWAFIRVKNEIKTIEPCLNSILPAIKKGVIGYHELPPGEKDDGTEKYILDFCKKNKGFIPFKYKYFVYAADDLAYKDLEKVKIENRLDSYYNAVLEKIPKNEWFIKIDCDHMYDSEKLKRLMYLPKNDNDVITISRINLHYEEKKLYLIKKNTIIDHQDHFLLKNNNIHFNFRTGYENNKFFAWEIINIMEKENRNKLKIYNTNLLTWHFPCVKSSRTIEKEQLILFDKKNIPWKKKKYYHVSNDMLDKEKIMEFCKKFK